MKTLQPIEIDTERLRLRQWISQDFEFMAAMNSNPLVMEFFPSALDRAASDAAVRRWQGQIAERGWGLWAAEIRNSGELIGFIGLQIPTTPLPFAPCVEVGWRLAHAYWGRGYATEGAQAALRIGFQQLGLEEIVSFTSVINLRSRAVMERLGMRAEQCHFQHPGIPEGSPLREHCLYRLDRQTWYDREDASRER